MRYSIVSTRQHFIESRALGGPRPPAQRTPDGEVHAREPGAEGTVCGLESVFFVRFDDLDFETTSMIPNKCDRCKAAIDEAD
jgi:hypothetical protein